MKQPVHRHIRAFSRTGAGLVFLCGAISNRLMQVFYPQKALVAGALDHAIFPAGHDRLRHFVIVG